MDGMSSLVCRSAQLVGLHCPKFGRLRGRLGTPESGYVHISTHIGPLNF